MNYAILLKQFTKTDFYEALFNVTKKSIGRNLDQSRVLLREKEIENLGGVWTDLTRGLKHPKISIATNARENSSITGVVVSDSTNGAVRKYALQMENRGPQETILQFREQALNTRGEMQTTTNKLWNTSDNFAQTDPMLDMFIKRTRNTGNTVKKADVRPNAEKSVQQRPLFQDVRHKTPESTTELDRLKNRKRLKLQEHEINTTGKRETGKSVSEKQIEEAYKPILKFEPVDSLSPEQIENEVKVLSERLKEQEDHLWHMVTKPKQQNRWFSTADSYPSIAYIQLKHHPECNEVNELLLKYELKTRRLRQECLEMRARLLELGAVKRMQTQQFKPKPSELCNFINENSHHLPQEDLSYRIADIAKLPEKEGIDAAVKMFAEDIKIPAEHIKIVPNSSLGYFNLGAGFDPEKGVIYTNFMPESTLHDKIVMLRHEMDHMQLFAQMCKAMGFHDFTKMLKQKYPNITEETVKKNYNNLVKNVDAPDFDVEYFKKAFADYNSGIQFSSRNYIGNPIERRAYRVQAKYDSSATSLSNAICSEINTEFNYLIDNIAKQTGKKFDEYSFNSLMGEYITSRLKHPDSAFASEEALEIANQILLKMDKNLQRGIPIEKTAELIKDGYYFNLFGLKV